MSEIFDRAIFLLTAGGPVLIILLILSIIALTIICLKFWQFHRLRLNETSFIKHTLDYWRAGQVNATMVELYRTLHPAARVIEVSIKGIAEQRVDEAVIREEVTREASDQIQGLRTHLRSLEVIATVSPLLGLLGTVIGMIDAFQAMEAAGSRVSPSLLSGGVWEALLTTAVGLAIAIPVVIALNWLEGKVEGARHTMEDAVTRVFTVNMKKMPEKPSTQGGM